MTRNKKKQRENKTHDVVCSTLDNDGRIFRPFFPQSIKTLPNFKGFESIFKTVKKNVRIGNSEKIFVLCNIIRKQSLLSKLFRFIEFRYEFCFFFVRLPPALFYRTNFLYQSDGANFLYFRYFHLPATNFSKLASNVLIQGPKLD